MQRVVLDTNILVSALWSSDGNPAKILEMVIYKDVQLFYSVAIMAEYQEVLNRSKFQFVSARIDLLLANIIRFGLLIDPEKSDFTMIDENDRIFYDAAKAAGAILVTGNRKHFPDDEDIMSPNDFCAFMP